MPINNSKESIVYSKSKSRLVLRLAEELGIDHKVLSIFWNRAKAKVALDHNCKLYVPDDYAIIVDIFKREIVKYFPDAVRKYPKLFPKELLKHRHEPIEPLGKVLKRYKQEIKEAKQKCNGAYQIVNNNK